MPKIEPNEIYALLIVFFLSLCIWHFPAKGTLPEFLPAIQLRDSVTGIAAPIHIQFAAVLEQAYSSLLGIPAASPQAIQGFLLVFPSFLLAAVSLFLYLAIRQISVRRAAAAFAVLLFAFSLPAMQFLPGMYSKEQLAAVLFSISALFLSLYVARQRQLLLLPSLLLSALAGYFSPSFALAGVALAISFAVPVYLKGDRRLPQMLLAAVFCAASSFLLPGAEMPLFSLENLAAFASGAPFAIAAASLSAVLFVFSYSSMQSVILFISAIAISAASPLAGVLLLAFPAAEGVQQAASERLSGRQAKLACALSLSFFGVFGAALLQTGDAVKSAAVAVLLCPLLPLIVHFYEYKNSRIFALIGVSLLVFSVSSAFLHQAQSQKEYSRYSDRDLSDALSYLSGKGASQVSLIGSQDQARFYLPSASLGNQSSLSRYLLTGKSPPDRGSYLAVSLSNLDEPMFYSDGGFEAYYFAGNFTSNSRNYAFFLSQAGGRLVRELDASGSFSLKDGQLVDNNGRVYSTVPLSRMILLSPEAEFASQDNRLLSLQEGAALPYFMKIYSGSTDELEKISQFGKVTIFRVK